MSEYEVAKIHTPDQESTAHAASREGHSLSFLGISLFTFIVYFRPYEWSKSLTWLATSAFWVALSTVIVFVLTQLSVGNKFTVFEKEVKLILLLVVTALLSIPFATDPSLAWGQFVDYSKVAVIFIMMVNVLRIERRLRILLLLILSITVAMAIAAVRDYAVGNLSLNGVRIAGIVGGLFSNPNDLALHFVTMAPIALVLSFISRSLTGKVLFFVSALFIIAGVLATFSRAGLLGLVFALGVLGWRLVRRNRGLLLMGLLGFLVIAPFVAGYSGRFTTTDASAGARMDDLKRSVLLALRHPLFGVGMSNYAIYSNTAHATHNAYTQVWAELGTAALAVYVAIIVIPLRKLKSIATRHIDNERIDRIGFLAAGLEASLYGYMVSSFFASVAYLWYLYYLVAFAICVRRLASEGGKAQNVSPHDFPDMESNEYSASI